MYCIKFLFCDYSSIRLVYLLLGSGLKVIFTDLWQRTMPTTGFCHNIARKYTILGAYLFTGQQVVIGFSS
jgi:hypothetical protein